LAQAPPSKIFISYSHADERLKNKLVTHLGALPSKAMIDLWTDRRIEAFQDWRAEIDRAMSAADIAILIVTANFLSSEFIQTRELPALLERHKTSDAFHVFPILAKECAWQLVPWLEGKQMRPSDGKAVWRDGGRHVDKELKWIVIEIDASLKLIRQAKEEAAKGRFSRAAARLSKLGSVEEIIAANRTLMFETQLQMDAQKQRKERLRILEETQAKIREIAQDVTASQNPTQDRMFKKWSEYLKS